MGCDMSNINLHNDKLTRVPPSIRRSALATVGHSVDAPRGSDDELGKPERPPAKGLGEQASSEAQEYHLGRLVASEDRDSRRAILSKRCSAGRLWCLLAAVRPGIITKAPLLSDRGGTDVTGPKRIPCPQINRTFLNIIFTSYRRLAVSNSLGPRRISFLWTALFRAIRAGFAAFYFWGFVHCVTSPDSQLWRTPHVYSHAIFAYLSVLP